jgi:exonuclease SbcC
MALLSSEEFAALEEREKMLLEAVRDAERQLIEKQHHLAQEQDKALTEQSIEEIAEEIRLREMRTSDVLQEVGKFDEILRKDKELRTEFADITKAIEVQKLEYMRWEKLNELIGSAKGDKFQRFAQGLTLVRLVRLANIHLRQLNDRYILEKIQSENLALQIIDTYQADERRAVESLSGGETFLISLALALGLSDLASNRTQIDSLFIDEGFGTLDNETLDTVMSALENLQATGKSVGVISHVEMMKERIATQIQVIKKGEGMSSICIVPGVRN